MLTAIPTRYSARSISVATGGALGRLFRYRRMAGRQFRSMESAGMNGATAENVATPAGFAEQAREALAKNTGIGSGELTAVLQAKGWVK